MDWFKFLQGVGAQVNPFDGGKTYGSVMQPKIVREPSRAPLSRQQVQQLQQAAPAHKIPEAARPIVPMGQDPKNYGYAPEITYNPNMNTNIPFSTHYPHPQWDASRGGAPGYMNDAQHAPIPSFMGNRYTQSNAGPEFTGPNAVDPKIFGYPPDGTVQDPRQQLLYHALQLHNLFQTLYRSKR